MADVTQILDAIEQGDPHASEQLLPLVYDELRKPPSSASMKTMQDPQCAKQEDAQAFLSEAEALVRGQRTSPDKGGPP
jgi:hypothetical protein